jgi:L-threonylcarbamoyladenylate synthase
MNPRIQPADASAIARACELLREGHLVAFPTETVYGLGANASDAAAVRRIFAAKGRPAEHPVIVHLASPHDLGSWARHVPDDAHRLARAFWPGPLTLILPRAPRVCDVVTGGQDSVGLRVPSHPVAQALLSEFGGGIAAPSANRFGHVSATTAQHVAQDLGDAVSLILDGGESDVGIESTIVSLCSSTAMVLRPGYIGTEALTEALGYVPRALTATSEAPRAPGTLAAHYAPHAPAWLVAADAMRAECERLMDRDERVGVLARTASAPDEFDGVWVAAPVDAAGYAHALYANLRALDGANVDVILIERVPDDGEWHAIRDRLSRAVRGEVSDVD